ncbi:transcriptional repressor p66-alpha isoform X3 [Melospiza georgiana]|uniref:transcriptional repressor p66-alpha isoform X3 n=1 Tax=Melospiza georgiana TaxID=44398 RepID=UPI0025ACA027|nr:transcriptional repressor p66-alpha isoform X3 [Melospiza georgiana]
MSEDSCRTRSQKRALERDSEPDSKKLRMDKGVLGSELGSEGDMKIKADPGAGKVPGTLKSGEVKATIKVELPAAAAAAAAAAAGDEPVDMSTSKGECRRERRVPSPDVIVLSDNEPSSPRVNGLARLALPEPGTEALLRSPEQRERLIKQLQEELRLEEAKLVLLKKLRQSQSQKETPAPKPSSSRVPGSGLPPPLLRGGQAAASKQSPQIVMPPLVRGAQQIHTIRQHSSTGPPPLLLAPRASVPSVQIQGQRIIQQGLIRVANVPNASLLVNIPQASPTSLKGSAVPSGQAGAAPAGGTALGGTGEAPGSRQAAAKLALRKQLEKTLLEIPPPKPPAPEMNFLPSAANNEFIYLVGLEEVVQNLLESQGGGGRVLPGALPVCPVPHGLHVPLAGGEERHHHVRDLHGLQPEEGPEGRAHEPAQGRLRQGPAAGAGDRAEDPAANGPARAAQGRARGAAPRAQAELQPAVAGRLAGRAAPLQLLAQAAELLGQRRAGRPARQARRQGRQQGRRRLEEEPHQHRRGPALRQPRAGRAQVGLGRGAAARVSPGHDPAPLHPTVGHVEIIPEGGLFQALPSFLFYHNSVESALIPAG